MTDVEPISDEILTELLDKERREKEINYFSVKCYIGFLTLIAGLTIGIPFGLKPGLIAAAIFMVLIGGLVFYFIHFRKQQSMS